MSNLSLISETTKQIILIMFALFLIVSGVGTLLVSNQIAFVSGLLFGTIFSALKMVLLEKTLEKALEMSTEKAVNYTRIHYVLRYFITFIAIFMAVLRNMDLIGVAIGILLSTPAVYIMHFKNKNLNKY
ncbi:MAG: ATP synthase subunit I [bacterium]